MLSGRRETIVDDAGWIGPEVVDHDLLNFSTENLPVTVSKSGAAGVSVGALKQEPFMRGVMIHKILRNEIAIPVRNRVRLEKGDVVHLVGLPQDIPTGPPAAPIWCSSVLASPSDALSAHWL